MSMFTASRKRETSPPPPPPSFSRAKAEGVRVGRGSGRGGSGGDVDMDAVRRRSVPVSKALPPPPHPAINPPKKKIYRVFDLALREQISEKRKLTDVIEKSKARQPPGLSVTVPYDRYENVRTKKQREKIDQEAERAKWVAKKRESLFSDIDLKKPSGPMEVGEKDPPPGLSSDGTRKRSPSPPPEPYLHSEDREENRKKIEVYGMPSNSPFFKVTEPTDGESALAFLVRQLKEAKVVRSLANERVKILEERIMAYRKRRRRKEGERSRSGGIASGTESPGRVRARARVSGTGSANSAGGSQLKEGERRSTGASPRSGAPPTKGRGNVREGSSPRNPLKRKRDIEQRQSHASPVRSGVAGRERGGGGGVRGRNAERSSQEKKVSMRGRRRRREEEEEESDSFIAEDDVEDESGVGSVYDHGYSAFISTLGFSRGPTSIDTYRNLGGKMSLADEMALTDMEKVSKGQRQYDDKRDASRGAVSATITDREEREREREEKRRRKQ
eukprot:TRINITY_DN3836_c0_g1_i1.p1 TRINITY_DN3836_c0_g1~~TRINITY_DN3836_c0_g1_i1.p1  ORF type:complete len:502 (+),score=121.61 TRINITY_DN3836_c0_g1_i1:165-1670(+)